MIFDSFIFYNELEILEYRLNLLKDVVDYFILVEATHTFDGNPKELYYSQNKEQFKKFENRIIHIIVSDFPYINNPNKEEVWKNEKYQRNCILHGFEKINSEDYIIISDVDELPDPYTLTIIKKENTLLAGQFEQDFYYYNLNSRIEDKWYSSKILKYNYY